MAISRKEVLKSRTLRVLVAGGMDKRQMVRQLCRLDSESADLSARGIGRCVVWAETQQGHEYWYSVAKRILEYP